MGGRWILIFAIFMGVVVLAMALKLGEIGGGGAGAKREENPILFWMGFSTTAVFTLIAVFILVWTFL